MNPNNTKKLTKKFLLTLGNGTVIKSNCHGPFKTVWQVNGDNHIEIWEEVKELGLNNRLCHTFSSIDHLDAFQDSIPGMPKATLDPFEGPTGGACHWYGEEKSAKVQKSSSLLDFVEELLKDIDDEDESDLPDGVTDEQFDSAYKIIEDFWVNLKELEIHSEHSSPFVSNLHLFLTMTTIMINTCDGDSRLENEMARAIYKFCKKVMTIIHLSGNKGGLA